MEARFKRVLPRHDSRRALRRQWGATLLLFGTLLLGAWLGGCEPRLHIPDDPARILAPAPDPAQHRAFVLDNGLKVFLASDPRADRSGAALSVGAGFFDDPAQHPGMAHFLEHMLFLGTDRYPEPGEYQSFMTANGGYSNAYTTHDHTNYYFQVSHEAFAEGIDRFSQFFIAPLFNPTYAEREVLAVDAEHEKNRENDSWRINRVVQLAYRQGHPLGRFGTGNRDTLAGVDQAALRAFYRTHYSSDRMALAVVSNLPLDALEAMVRERFAAVPRRETQPQPVAADFLPRMPALRLLTVQPIKDQRYLLIEFPTPPVLAHFRAQPMALLSHVLGHEGQGSLLSLLKAEFLATGLSAGQGINLPDVASVELRIALTPQGLAEYSRVIQLVLGAIEGLRTQGIPRHVFQEARTMAEIDLRYSPRPESASEARRIAAMMQDYPLASLPDGPLRYEIFAPPLYREVLNALRPDNMLVTLVAKGVPTQFEEPYYGTAYGYREVGGEVYDVLARAEPDPRWAPPQPNPFIPRDTTVHGPTGPLKLSGAALLRLAQNSLDPAVLARLAALQGRSYTSPQAAVADLEEALPRPARAAAQREVLENSLPLPRRILDDARGTVWYAPSLRFREPRAQIDLRMFVADAAADARRAALGALYVRSLEESLNEMAYPIRQAGLAFGLGWGVSGLNLTLSGYSDRMLYLLETLFDALQTVELSEARFAAVQEQMLRSLRNAPFDVPYRQARYFTERLWSEPTFPREALADAVAALTLDDVRRFAQTAFGRTYLEGTVVGNLPAEAVQETLLQAHGKLGSAPLPAALQVREQTRSLPRGADFRYVQALPVGNSLIDVFYEAGQTEPRLRGALLLAGRPLKDAFYFDMRTRQQLGYIVYAGFDQMQQTLGLIFLIQSGTYAPDDLQRRMDAFVPAFIAQLRGMPPAQFEQYRKAVIDAKLEPPDSLAEEARRLNWVAFEHGAQFDHVSTDIAAVQELEPGYVADVVEQVLVGSGRRRLGIWLVGQGHTLQSRSGRPVTPESMERLAPATAAADGG